MRVLVTGQGAHAATGALVLARALAISRRTILVDCDGEEAERNGFGALADAPGLGELVAGQTSFSEAIHRDRISRLHLLPRGHGPTAGEELDLTIDALSQTYDFLVLATPAGDLDPAALELGPSADFVVIIAPATVDDPKVIDLRNRFVRSGSGEVLIAARQDGGEQRDRSAA
jgi:Mrp family chromosome partitioning ATPase